MNSVTIIIIICYLNRYLLCCNFSYFYYYYYLLFKPLLTMLQLNMFNNNWCSCSIQTTYQKYNKLLHLIRNPPKRQLNRCKKILYNINCNINITESCYNYISFEFDQYMEHSNKLYRKNLGNNQNLQ